MVYVDKGDDVFILVLVIVLILIDDGFIEICYVFFVYVVLNGGWIKVVFVGGLVVRFLVCDFNFLVGV